MMICYNNIDIERLYFAHGFGVKLYNATEKDQFLPMDRWGVSWKICPPRMRPESYELILDNDVVIHGTSDIFEKAIAENKCLMTEGHFRNFGKYADKLPSKLRLNSGLIGLPPNYDFGKDLKEVFMGWDDTGEAFDEQGLIALALTKNPYYIMPLSELHICHENYVKTPFGIHFVRVNSGAYTFWDEHRKNMVKFL